MRSRYEMIEVTPTIFERFIPRAAKLCCTPHHTSYLHRRSPSEAMAPQITSIRSFFQPEVPSMQKTQKPAAHHEPSDTSDGFTPNEIEAALHPSLHNWQPRTAYNDTAIRDLVPGPGCVVVKGRVVNLHHIATPSKMPKAATGCLKLTVKDDTGAFTVSTSPSGLLV